MTLEEKIGDIRSCGLRALMNPKALIFDMDGVIVDSEPLHEHAKRLALHCAGIELDESVLPQYTGRSDRDMITDLARNHGRSDDEIESILVEKRRVYESLEPGLKPVKGALEFLFWSHERYRLAIATSATTRNRISTLARLRIAELFEVAVDCSSVVQPKPSPEVFLRAVAALEVAAEDCWVIEDSVNGVIAATGAHCFTVGLTTSFDAIALRNAGANIVVDSFSELKRTLDF